MMPNWTKQQEQAIRARNHTILVSALRGRRLLPETADCAVRTLLVAFVLR